MRARLWIAILLLFVSLDAASEVVGRVLVAVGEVVATRAGRDVSLGTGANVETGDLIRTGEASIAQLRFDDASVVAIRARSRFLVESFRFTGADDGISEAAFRLLRGGLRTLTGLIGARSGRYRMVTPMATLGIRGTAYSLVVCEQDCREDDGSLAPDGAYGLVFEGRVSVANPAGEVEFGADEAFFVADLSTPPQRLLGRPGFLRDRQEARARRGERREQVQARVQAVAAVRELVARIATTAEVRPVGVLGTPAAPIAVVSDLQDESGNVALIGPGLGAGVAFATSVAPVAIVDGGRGTVIELDAERGFLERFSFNGGAQTGERRGAAALDRGRIDGDGGAVWGRWSPGGVVQVGDLAGAPSTGVHYFFGNLTPEALFTTAPSLPAAVRYDYAGGPRPTDGQGNAGDFLNGTFVVNFLDRTIGGAMAYRVDQVTYALPVPEGTALVTGRGFVGFNVSQRGAGQWSCACSNTTGSIESYSVSGLFLGSRAQGLGVTFATDDSRLGRTAGTGIFRCVSGGCR